MIMHGYNGVVGRVITDLAADDRDIEIAADTDLRQGTNCGYPILTSPGECDVSADVIVDFASVKTVDGLLKFSTETGTPVVLCTTGFSQEQLAVVRRTSVSAAVLHSANAPLDINLLLKLAQDTARVLAGSGFDIKIVEKHYSQKMDVPGGTAIALADSMNGVVGDSYEYIYDRSGEREKRSPKEIGTSITRGGPIAGEHDVIFADRDEVMTPSHTTYSKAIFAKGALEAVRLLTGKGPGLYTVADVVQP